MIDTPSKDNAIVSGSIPPLDVSNGQSAKPPNPVSMESDAPAPVIETEVVAAPLPGSEHLPSA
jgi:hypothetical protein